MAARCAAGSSCASPERWRLDVLRFRRATGRSLPRNYVARRRRLTRHNLPQLERPHGVIDALIEMPKPEMGLVW